MALQRLPLWVQVSTFILAMNAGMVNTIGLLAVLHQSISHMTGNASFFAIHLEQHDWAMAGYVALVITCFMLGSLCSGFILGDSQLKLSRRYQIPLGLVAFFLFTCWAILPHFPHYALLWAVAAMGVQNAMMSYYRGAIIRTTHMTGTLTDIGLMLGYKLRGLKIELRRLSLGLFIVSGFVLGAMMSATLYTSIGYHSLLLPISSTILLNLGYHYLLTKDSAY